MCRGEYPFAFTNGVQASWLEVDTDTGFVKLLQHWVVEDCGTIINPQLVDEQIRGGVVQGLGAALFEKCIYDERGQLTNANMADYLVPMSGEMPDIDVGHVVSPTRGNGTGRQGRGRGRNGGSGGGGGNAVNDALRPFGAIITEIPLTPQVILTALGRDLNEDDASRRYRMQNCQGRKQHDQDDHVKPVDVPPSPAGDGQRRRGACGIAVSHQFAAGAGGTRSRSAFPFPLTGPYGTEAQDQVRAAQLAIAQFNDAGGLNGRKAELLVRDDKLNPGEAATRTLELVEKEKVNFVVGSLSAAVQLAINNVTKERGVIFNSISQSDADQRGRRFQPLHLPRSAESASDVGRGRPLCVLEVRQEGRVPDRGLCLRPRDGPRLPRGRQGLQYRKSRRHPPSARHDPTSRRCCRASRR